MISLDQNGDNVPELQMLLADLSPGDARSAALDLAQFKTTRVRSAAHPLFHQIYEFLWQEFGGRGELETREVIEQRLGWRPEKKLNGAAMLYEMIAVTSGETLIAARDHTAIVNCNKMRGGAVVHLSHVLVDPAWRRTGLSGWLRAWPIQTARECLRRSGDGERSNVILAGEMEPPDTSRPDRMNRLHAYERAGFVKPDPSVVPYFQPDFRAPEEIDRAGGPSPLSMVLMLRHVGRELEPHIAGDDLRDVVECLYHMYETTFRDQDMRGVWENLNRFPADDAKVKIKLMKPTE